MLEIITSDGWNVGIYFIVVTNSNSSLVMSSIFKSNFSSRISFRTTSSTESRQIVNASGAEKLKLYGNALFLSKDFVNAAEIETSFVEENCIRNVVNYIKSNNPDKIQFVNGDYLEEEFETKRHEEDQDDPIYNEVVDFAVRNGKISSSLLQRKFRLGFNRATRMIDILEEKGIVGPQDGSKPRDVLVKLKK